MRVRVIFLRLVKVNNRNLNRHSFLDIESFVADVFTALSIDPVETKLPNQLVFVSWRSQWISSSCSVTLVQSGVSGKLHLRIDRSRGYRESFRVTLGP